MNIRSTKYLSNIFLASFPELGITTSATRPELTEALIGYWGDLGKEQGFEVYSSKDPTEYLVDLCWYYQTDNFVDHWMELALESELNSNFEKIEYDFWKLIDVKAYTKVGIFRPLLKEKDSVLERLSELVTFSGIKIPTEKYLIIFLIDHGVKANLEERLEVITYDISYLGDVKQIENKYFTARAQKRRVWVVS